jgi:hypothetical protein
VKMSRCARALLICALLGAEASPAVLADPGGSSPVAQSDAAGATDRPNAGLSRTPRSAPAGSASGRAVVVDAARAGDRASAQPGFATPGHPTRQDAPSTASQRRSPGALPAGPGLGARGNADRLRAMLSAQARARLVGQPRRRPIESAHAGSDGVVGIHAPRAASPAHEPALAAAKMAVRSVTKLPAAVGVAATRAPHGGGPGGLGGPVIGPAARSAAIDGSRLHHRL